LAVDALAVGGTLLVPFATYKVNTVHLTKSINIDLQGSTLVSTAYASGVSKKIFYSEAADAAGVISIKNGKLDGAGSTRGDTAAEMEPLIQLDSTGTVVLKDVEIYGHAAGIQSIPAALKDRLIACVVVRDAFYVTFDNILLHDNWNEQLWVYNGPNSVCYTEVLNCKSYNGQVNPANTPVTITGGYAKVSGCNFRSTNGSVINIQCTTATEVINNILYGESGDGYGINVGHDNLFGATNNVIISGNYIADTFRGGIQCSGSNIKITNNIMERPGGFGIKFVYDFASDARATYVPDYPAQYAAQMYNITISGNTITDTAYDGSITGAAIYCTSATTGYSLEGLTIRDNKIRQPGANATRNMYYCVVLGNIHILDMGSNVILDATADPIYVKDKLITARIKYNYFAATGVGTQLGSTILFSATGKLIEDILIEKNHFYGPPPTSNKDINFFGGIFTNLCVVNNRDILAGIDGNASALAALYYLKNDYPRQASVPTVGTYYTNDIVPASLTASSVEGWWSNRRGTLGTLNGGATTGSMTAGQNTVTLSSVTGLSVGQIISVFGAISTGTGAIVTDITGFVVTLSEVAGGTVAGAAVNFVNPTFKTLGVTGA